MRILRFLPFAALAFGAAIASAHPGGAPVPPPEALATAPGLTPAQQAEVRRILIENRDAMEAAHDKLRAEAQALHRRARAEHEKIDEATAQKLRKVLGEDGYRQFAQWQHEGPGPGRFGHGRGMHGPGMGRGHGMGHGPGPAGGPGADGGPAAGPAAGAPPPGHAPLAFDAGPDAAEAMDGPDSGDSDD